MRSIRSAANVPDKGKIIDASPGRISGPNGRWSFYGGSRGPYCWREAAGGSRPSGVGRRRACSGWPRSPAGCAAFIDFEAERAPSVANRHLEMVADRHHLSPARRSALSGALTGSTSFPTERCRLSTTRRVKRRRKSRWRRFWCRSCRLRPHSCGSGPSRASTATDRSPNCCTCGFPAGAKPLGQPQPRNPKYRESMSSPMMPLARLRQLLAAYENESKGYLSRARIMEERVYGGAFDHLGPRSGMVAQ